MGAPGFPDWVSIANLKARYCRLLDLKEWSAFADLFTEDVLLDTSASGGPRLAGREAVVAMVRQSIEAARTVHQVHMPEITVEQDQASAIWPMQDRLVWPDGRTLTGFGHYHERYRRQAGGWKIAESRLTRLMLEMQRPTGEG
ncbi:nuclear transport factor 2 family protein [Sphingobium sp. BYY-5]|uniref:nuclear transport factor 2 family protein n=1 Tax=Sphingobium sp. BYY-5 TaxID=2926400 RepID=UPI001FA6C57A|nr:nuclear transport factor 2 family protein [Sphingobium sp. BYY-5]MCI4592344.1 nuclear transport factor 2 family protein [Sphingobium sp. BYY-5]